jgi:hypothetical protein
VSAPWEWAGLDMTPTVPGTPVERRASCSPRSDSLAVTGSLLLVSTLVTRTQDGRARPTCDYDLSCLTNPLSIDVGEFNHRN